MKLVTFEQNGTVRIGAVKENGIVDLTAVSPDMLSLIDMGTAGLTAAQAHLQTHAPDFQLAEVHLLAPIPHPRRNIMCLGLNYAEHAEESQIAKGQTVELPEFPIIFTKATTAVNGPNDPFLHNAIISDKIDYEVELGVIISNTGKNIPPAEAMNYVFGYTVINDISARDLQSQHKQYFKGKSLDYFTSHADLVKRQAERKAAQKAAAAAPKKTVANDAEWTGDDFVKQSDALSKS